MRLASATLLALVSGCGVPTETSDVVIGDATIPARGSIFAVHEVVFEQLIGGNRVEDVAVVLFGDLSCAEVPAACDEPRARGDHVLLELILNEPLFGGVQLGDYDLPGEGTLAAVANEQQFALVSGGVDLAKLDAGEFAASYDVVVTGDIEMSGTVLAQQCAALAAHLACGGEGD